MGLGDFAVGAFVGNISGKSSSKDYYSEVLDEKELEKIKYIDTSLGLILNTVRDDKHFIEVVNSFLSASKGNTKEIEQILITSYTKYISAGKLNDEFYINILDNLEKTGINKEHLDELSKIKSSQNNVDLAAIADMGEKMVDKEVSSLIEKFKTIPSDKLELINKENIKAKEKLRKFTGTTMISGMLLTELTTMYFAFKTGGVDSKLAYSMMMAMVGTMGIPLLPVGSIVDKFLNLLNKFGLKSLEELKSNDDFIIEFSKTIEKSLNSLNNNDSKVSLLLKLEEFFNSNNKSLSNKIFPKIFENLSDEVIDKIPEFFLEKYKIPFKARNDKSLKNSYYNKNKSSIKRGVQ